MRRGRKNSAKEELNHFRTLPQIPTYWSRRVTRTPVTIIGPLMISGLMTCRLLSGGCHYFTHPRNALHRHFLYEISISPTGQQKELQPWINRAISLNVGLRRHCGLAC